MMNYFLIKADFAAAHYVSNGRLVVWPQGSSLSFLFYISSLLTSCFPLYLQQGLILSSNPFYTPLLTLLYYLGNTDLLT
jgi:hypothetical protein